MDYNKFVQRASDETGIPVEELWAHIETESGGRADAVSPAGARGLMQLMPDTAKELGVDPDDPEQNILGGARYLRKMKDKYRDDDMARAAYNYGPGNVDRAIRNSRIEGGDWKDKLPQETKDYLRKIPEKMGVRALMPPDVDFTNARDQLYLQTKAAEASIRGYLNAYASGKPFDVNADYKANLSRMQIDGTEDNVLAEKEREYNDSTRAEVTQFATEAAKAGDFKALKESLRFLEPGTQAYYEGIFKFGATRPIESVAAAVLGDGGLDEIQALEDATRRLVYDLRSRAVADQSGTAAALTIYDTNFIAFDVFKDEKDFVQAVGGTPDNPNASFSEVITYVRDLDPMARGSWIYKNWSKVQDAFEGNPYKTAEVFGLIHDVDITTEEIIRKGIAVLDIAFLSLDAKDGFKVLGKLGRAMTRSSVADRISNYGEAGKKIAARLQVAAAKGDEVAQAAVADAKVSPPVAADPLNVGNPLTRDITTPDISPEMGRALDEIDGVAQQTVDTAKAIDEEVIAARKTALEDIKAELLSVAGEAQTRGAEKATRAELRQYELEIARREKELEALAGDVLLADNTIQGMEARLKEIRQQLADKKSVGNKKALRAELDDIAKKKVAAEERALKEAGFTADEISELKGKAGRLKEQLARQNAAKQAEADLNAIERGEIPAKYASVLDEVALNARKRAEARAAGGNVVAKTGTAPARAAGGNVVAATARAARQAPSEMQGPGFGVDVEAEARAARQAPSEMQGPGFGVDVEAENWAASIRQDTARRIQAVAAPEQYMDVAMARLMSDELFALRQAGVKKAAIDPESINQTGFKVKYELEGIEQVKEVQWKRDRFGDWSIDPAEVQGWTASFAQRFGKNVLSPETVLRDIDAEMVKTMTFSGMQEYRIVKRLMSETREMTRNLNKEQLKLLDGILHKGDFEERVFTATDLFSGAANGVKHDPAVVEAYFRFRELYDNLWSIQNASAKKYLEFMGMQEISFKVLADEVSLIGKEVMRPFQGTLRAAVLEGDAVRYIDVAEEMSSAQIAALKEKGYTFVELMDDYRVPGKPSVKHMFVRPENQKQLRQRVLNYQEGYIPRYRTAGLVYVKDKDKNTVAIFDGMKAAKAYVQRQRSRGVELMPLRDNELPITERDVLKFDMAGGLFSRPRTKTPLIMGDEAVEGPGGKLIGTPAETADIWQATSQYIQTVARVMPLNEYRAVLLDQLSTAIKQASKTYGGPGFTREGDVFSDIVTGGGPKVDARLTAARDYTLRQLGLKSNDERKFKWAVDSIIDALEGRKGGQWLRNKIREQSYGDGISLKAMIFHPTLGFFSLAQLPVQFSGATIAMSAHPIHGLKAAIDATYIGPMVMMSREQMLEWQKVHKFSDDIIEDALALQRSGYLSNVMNTGDMRLMRAGIHAGMAQKSADFVIDAGTLPYQVGTVMARAVTWNIAKRRWKAANPGQKLDDAAIYDITQDALRLDMNLQRENAANWQENILAVPTMYLQHTAKFYENLYAGLFRDMGTKTGGRSGWTQAEAARVLAGQVILYGLAFGSGLGVLDVAKKVYGGMTDQEAQSLNQTDPRAAAAIEDGVIGMLAREMGVNVVVGQRLGTVQGTTNTLPFELAKFIIEDEQVRVRDLIGPAGTLYRYGEAGAGVYGRLRAIWNTDDTAVQTKAELLGAMEDVLRISSSWSNAEKASQLLKQRVIRAKSGSILFLADEDYANTQTYIGRMMGFQTTEEFNLYRGKETVKQYDDRMNDATTAMMQLMVQRIKDEQRLGTVDAHKAYNGRMLVLKNMLENGAEFEEAQSRALRRFHDPETQEDKVRADLYRQWINSGGETPLMGD